MKGFGSLCRESKDTVYEMRCFRFGKEIKGRVRSEELGIGIGKREDWWDVQSSAVLESNEDHRLWNWNRSWNWSQHRRHKRIQIPSGVFLVASGTGSMVLSRIRPVCNLR